METPKLKELQEQYDRLSDEKSRIDLLVAMALEIRTFDIEHAMEMAEEIMQRSRAANYQLGIGRGLNLKGNCLWQTGDYDEGLEVLEQAYAVAKSIKDQPLQARVLNNFGYIYRDRGDLGRALSAFEKALAINERLGDELTQAVNLASIAYIHYDLNDYDSALQFALRCLPVFERAHDYYRLNILYHILGNIYFKQEKHQEALRYFEENLERTEPDSSMYMMALSGIGKVLYKMQQFEKAENYLTEALRQAEEGNNVEVQITCEFYLGRLNMDEEHYRKSLAHFTAAYDLAEEYSRRHDLMSVHEMLSMLYDKMGDIPKAFHHLKTFEKIKEEIFTQTTLNRLRNLQIRQQIELAQKEKEVAERTAQLKQQFMANMSHEIRTPMNAIVGMTRLLLSKKPDADQLRYLKAIQQSADNLLVIINDILDLSKIEAGKIMIEQISFSLHEVLESLKDMLMLKAEEKSLQLLIKQDPAIPPRLKGDPTRINQVLINLVGNAIKFTNRGTVSVSVQLQEKKDNKYYVRFDIADTGIGIAPDQINQIFESFTQAAADTTRKYGGTGLGLTISKQLTNLMRGEISVQSKLGEGTTFTVVLPLEEGQPEQQDNTQSVVDKADMERLKTATILLVEDNEFNRMVAEDTLREMLPGIRIDVAEDGRQAVDKVQARAYDLVLMDIQMPVMNGVEATRMIRTSLPEPRNNISIIAMTANVLQEDVQQYFAAGMNAYVSKPFRTEELLIKMASVLGNRPVAAEETQTGHPKAELVLPEQVTDMQFLRTFTGGRAEKMQKYVGMFLENAPRLLAQVDEALKQKDLPSLKIAAHSLKPQLSYMGVKEEISHIFLIEQTAGEQGHIERLPELIHHLKRVCSKAFEELNQFKMQH